MKSAAEGRQLHFASSAKGLEKDLVKAMSESAEDGKEIHSGVSVNLILLAPSKEFLVPIEEAIVCLSTVHAGRIFTIIGDETRSDIGVEIDIRLTPLSKTEEVATEVIRIVAPERLFQALPSILRAHLLSGITTELFIVEPLKNSILLNLLSPFVEECLLSSRQFENHLEEIEIIASRGAKIVDLEWIGMAAWRDQLKYIFERFGGENLPDRLESIALTAITNNDKVIPANALLFAGWLVNRLGLDVVAFGNGGYECRFPIGMKKQSIRLDLKVEKGPEHGTLVELSCEFTPRGGLRTHTVLRMNRSNSETLETLVDLGPGGASQFLRLSRPLDSGDTLEYLTRYYVIGESVTNYRAALKSGIELQNLRSNNYA